MIDPKVIQAIVENTRQMQKRMQGIAEALRPTLQVFEEFESRWQQSIEALKPAFAQMARMVQELPETTRRLHRYLASRSWYLSFYTLSFAEMGQLANWAQEENHAAIEDYVTDLVRRQIDNIESTVCDAFPHRAALLESAFQAHARSEYELCIPVMLAQADGIHHEILDHFLFAGNDLETTRRKILIKLQETRGKADSTSIVYLMLGPLLELNAMNKNFRDIDEIMDSDPEFRPLNRHAVLHGRDIEYATEANSLRAIALLDYLYWVSEDLS